MDRQGFVREINNVAVERFTSVQVDTEAAQFLDAFDVRCDSLINSTEDDIKKRILDRAHEKVLRVAALLAVTDNCLQPSINLAHAKWARDLVLRDTEIMNQHIGYGRLTGEKQAGRRK